MACASSNTQKFIDLLETMFGDLGIDDIDISELETETTKGLCEEAEMAETASVIAKTGAISKDKITRVYITSLPVPHEFGIPPDSLPKTENVQERSTKNPTQKVTRFYYALSPFITKQTRHDDAHPQMHEYQTRVHHLQQSL